jgi:hypothetical protein
VIFKTTIGNAEPARYCSIFFLVTLYRAQLEFWKGGPDAAFLDGCYVAVMEGLLSLVAFLSPLTHLLCFVTSLALPTAISCLFMYWLNWA